MEFNKRIAKKILLDIQSAKKLHLSFKILDNNIRLNLDALDSTFPRYLKNMIEGVLTKIEDHQEEQYAATLNTPLEGTQDETIEVGDLFDVEIDSLERYIS